jgi:hypothetical protein
MKYWFKECPKCHGDLREESNTFGDYITCMQCGYTLKQIEEMRLRLDGTLKHVPERERAKQ